LTKMQKQKELEMDLRVKITELQYEALKTVAEASGDTHDLENVHEYYHDDIVVAFPQSGERIRGKQNIYELKVRLLTNNKSRSLKNSASYLSPSFFKLKFFCVHCQA
jgi:hypothetical protein